MFSIRILLGLSLLIFIQSGCSSRFPNTPTAQKHRVNHFDPKEADKTHKVSWEDQGVENGQEPEPSSDVLSQKTLTHPTMKPYKVNGKRYTPHTTRIGKTYKGVASWYGPDFNGKQTSNGEIYDMYAYTAAHKTLPMHTIVKVTHLDSGKEVVVRINDRGPFVKGRIIDLSKAAAYAIDMTQKGTAPVKLEVLGFDETPSSSFTRVAHAKPKKQAPKSSGALYVQIGSFKNIEGAKAYQERYMQLGERYKAVLKTADVNGDTIYKVALSGFSNEAEARRYIEHHYGFENAFILRD